MSKDWTHEELQAASQAMKDAGQLGYEGFCEELDRMKYKTPSDADIHYSYSTRGYMMYYKGQPIGGAGIDKSAKGSRRNLSLFKQSEEAGTW